MVKDSYEATVTHHRDCIMRILNVVYSMSTALISVILSARLSKCKKCKYLLLLHIDTFITTATTTR